MKDLKLNLSVDIVSKSPLGGDAGFWTVELHTEDRPTFVRISALVNDWLTLHSAHESDVKLIEQLHKALNTVRVIYVYDEKEDGKTRCCFCDVEMGKPHKKNCDINNALDAYTAWRGEK